MQFSGKHIIDKIDGVRCTVVETGIDQNRLSFLKDLLEFNQYTVKTDKDATGANRIGVTDVVFNPVIRVYSRNLKTRTGHIVTPAYWFQISTEESEAQVQYWTK